MTVPVGGIIIWSGSIASIPGGYQLCNGTNGTPDLRNKFVLGAGNSYAVGATGGSDTLDYGSHTHTTTPTGSDSGHSHTLTGATNAASATQSQASGIGAPTTVYDGLSHSHTFSWTTTVSTHTHSITGSYANESASSNSLPRYYALAYIQRLS